MNIKQICYALLIGMVTIISSAESSLEFFDYTYSGDPNVLIKTEADAQTFAHMLEDEEYAKEIMMLRLDGEYEEYAYQLLDNPSLDPKYKKDIQTFITMSPHYGNKEEYQTYKNYREKVLTHYQNLFPNASAKHAPSNIGLYSLKLKFAPQASTKAIQIVLNALADNSSITDFSWQPQQDRKDAEIIGISEILKNNKTIDSFTINAYGNTLNNDDWKTLINGLTNNRSLKKIDFQRASMEKTTVNRLIKALANNDMLQEIYLPLPFEQQESKINNMLKQNKTLLSITQ